MLISKTCVYAIRASIYLAAYGEGRFISIKEIAQKLNVSFHFLTKILQILTKGDVIESAKGVGGGVSLKCEPADISIYDIITLVDGKKVFDDCLLGIPGCSEQTPCPLHRSWGVLREDLRHMLQHETLQGLAVQLKDGIIRLCE